MLCVRTFTGISGLIGSGHSTSPAREPAAMVCATRASSLPRMPATRSPSAVSHAPVRVATSTIRSGFDSVASTRASASTSRPSASVFSTSTVEPPYIVRTSPGRVASPETMFSAIGTKVVTRTGSPSSAIAKVAATTAAAPAMSHFIVRMLVPGLMVSPPES